MPDGPGQAQPLDPGHDEHGRLIDPVAAGILSENAGPPPGAAEDGLPGPPEAAPSLTEGGEEADSLSARADAANAPIEPSLKDKH